MSSWILAALCALQAPPEAIEQDPDRPTYSVGDLKLLRESNLFSPKRSSSSSSGSSYRREERRSESAPARPKPLQVTGFVLDPASKSPRAILEDRNSDAFKTLKEPLFAKAGDQAAGWTVSEVLADQLTIVQGETTKTLRVGESFPEAAVDTGAAAPASADAPAAPAKPEAAPALDEGAKNDVLERLRQKNKKKRADDEP
jgi:hypothetical protein